MPNKAKGLEGQTTRPCLNMRVSRQMRAKLEAAALASGRSIATEAEMRLELSFASEKPSLTAEDVRQIVREEMVKPYGCHPHSLTIPKGSTHSTGTSRYVGMGLWFDENDNPVFDPDAPPRFVPAAVAASRGLPAVDLHPRAPMTGDGCRDGNCADRKGYCGHQGCPWPNKRERAAMASEA